MEFNSEIYEKVDNSKLNIYVNEDKNKSILITDDGILVFTDGRFIMYNKNSTIKFEV